MASYSRRAIGHQSSDPGRSEQRPLPARSNADANERLRQHQALRDLVRGTNTNAFESTGLRPEVFSKALRAFERAFAQGRSDEAVVTIIDYELHSSAKRMWVIDLETKRLLFHEHVTHGRGSDPNHDGFADRMSNVNGSNSSNVGLMVTGETYTGARGFSLKLDGLEPGFNDNARSRGIVVHGATYADEGFLQQHGKTGRSQGCPAVDPDVNGAVIETIKDGNLVFAYYPDPNWLRRSTFLNN